MAGSYILGIDLGTSSLKTVLYTTRMEMVRSSKQLYTQPGMPVTADDWWRALLGALRGLQEHVDLHDIACISFSGYNAFVGVDKSLAPSTPVILYYQAEPSAYMRDIFTEDEAKEVFHRACTNIFGSGIMSPGIRYLKDHSPDAYAATDCFLYSSGFIAAKLTDVRMIDASRASLSGLHDPRPVGTELCWDEDLLRMFQIDAQKLPKIFNSWDTVGAVTPDAAAQTGLLAGTPVIAGSMDSLCAALGNGILGSECLLDIGGSAGGLACVSDTPRAHSRLYLSRYALPGFWCNNAPLMSSARLFDWFTQNFAPGWTMEDYIRAVDTSPLFARGMIFLPYVGGARYPYWSSKTQGHLLHFAPECTISDMARAIVEGLSCAYRSILDDLLALGIQKPQYILAAGGDARFGAWVQAKSSHMRMQYELSDAPEASSRGAALIGAYAIGSVPDPAAYLKSSKKPGRIVSPETPADAFEAHYQRFLADCETMYQDIVAPNW